MNKILYYGAWVIIILMFALMGFSYYQKFYPVKTLEVYDQPLKIITPEVKAGESFKYHISYCKYTDKPATVIRQLIGKDSNPDGYTTVPIQTAQSNVPQGCKEIVSSTIVPEGNNFL